MTRRRVSPPPLRVIAEFWEDNPDALEAMLPRAAEWASLIGWGEPFCFACRSLAPVEDGPGAWARAAGYLERAHLANHVTGGSSAVENLIPLCTLCHDLMSRIVFGTKGAACRWITELNLTTEERLIRYVSSLIREPGDLLAIPTDPA